MLVFSSLGDGKHWDVRANLATGATVANCIGHGRNFIERNTSFITNMHKSHGYPPGKPTIRLWWAVIVDGMGFLMVFWGLTGLIMWWQMKGQRTWGLAGLIACAILTCFIWIGMWREMTLR